MRIHATLLIIALVAGAGAVATAALGLESTGSASAVQYVQTTSMDMPGAGGVFGSGKQNTTVTTTTSTNRFRTDNGDTSTIVQCDLKRIVTLDNKAKTYSATTFADLTKSIGGAQGLTSGDASKGTGSFTLKSDEKPDNQTQVIAGLTAHHVVRTMSVTENGTGQCGNMQITMTQDEWYATNEAPFTCPNAASGSASGSNPLAGNPCFSHMQVASSGDAHSDRLPLKETDSTTVMGMTIVTHSLTTSVKKIPYDSSFFDIPSGYAQAQQ
jgi:hypothetical protein